MAFYGINQGNHFIIPIILLHVLMSTWDLVWCLKLFHQLVLEPPWMTFKLQFFFFLVIYGFYFLICKPFFWGVFSFGINSPFWSPIDDGDSYKTLFGAKPIFFFFWFFGAQLMGFKKLGFLMVLHFMHFCTFLGLDWSINV